MDQQQDPRTDIRKHVKIYTAFSIWSIVFAIITFIFFFNVLIATCQVLMGLLCIITGIHAKRCLVYHSSLVASRYSTWSFITLCGWIILGLFCILIVSLVFIVAIVPIFFIVIYLGLLIPSFIFGTVLILRCRRQAKSYYNSTLSQQLNPGNGGYFPGQPGIFAGGPTGYYSPAQGIPGQYSHPAQVYPAAPVGYSGNRISPGAPSRDSGNSYPSGGYNSVGSN